MHLLHTELVGSSNLSITTNADLAHQVEQLICNHQVVGSSPAIGTRIFGVWRSLVAHLLWEQGVQGSNPCTPTSIKGGVAQLGERLLCKQ